MIRVRRIDISIHTPTHRSLEFINIRRPNVSYYILLPATNNYTRRISKNHRNKFVWKSFARGGNWSKSERRKRREERGRNDLSRFFSEGTRWMDPTDGWYSVLIIIIGIACARARAKRLSNDLFSTPKPPRVTLFRKISTQFSTRKNRETDGKAN